jgi:integrase/recombinase XerD
LVASPDRMMRPRQRQTSINEDEASPKRGLRGDPFSMVGKPLSTSFDAGVDLRNVQIAARHADPRTTMRYDRARKNLDRHPNYILAAYMASGT